MRVQGDEHGRIEIITSHGTVYAVLGWEGDEARGREPAGTGWEFQAEDGAVLGHADRRAGDDQFAVTTDDAVLGMADNERVAAEMIAEHHA